VRITRAKPRCYTHVRNIIPVQVRDGDDHFPLTRLHEENKSEWEVKIGYYDPSILPSEDLAAHLVGVIGDRTYQNL
jgi:hypothetical protein